MKNLDPKAKWLFFIRNVWTILVVTVALFTSFLDSIGFWIGLIAAFGFTYLWASLVYKNYRYELAPDAFRKEFGVIVKRATGIPYERIQNVETVRSLLSRFLGLSDLTIQTAGMSGMGRGVFGGNAEGRLLGLSKAEAAQLQNELVTRSRGFGAQPVATPSQPGAVPPAAPPPPPMPPQSNQGV